MEERLLPYVEVFRNFARHAVGQSPLYTALSEAIAEDPACLTLAAREAVLKRPANLLFAAVHYLLKNSYRDAPLAAYYASLNETLADPEAAFPAFRAFCLDHAVEIAAIMRERSVNTNEVQRAAVLMPVYCQVAERVKRPLQHVEVGCSGGLLLNWPYFRYDYGEKGRVGHPFGSLTLSCETDGPLPLPPQMPPVQERVGIDLDPVNVTKAKEAAWLEALIWPEQLDRIALLRQAIQQLRLRPPRLVKGSIFDVLEKTVRQLPRAGGLMVSHSLVLAYLSEEETQGFFDLLDRLAQNVRPLWRVGMEMADDGLCDLVVQEHGTSSPARMLARAQSHGRSLTWLGAEAGKPLD